MFLHKHFGGGQDTGEVDDIIRNLGFILATKRGCGYFLETYGLTDTGFRTMEELVVTMTREITENVRLYEPRVELTDIDEDYTGARPRLIVYLRVRDRREELTLTVNLTERTFDIRQVASKSRERG